MTFMYPRADYSTKRPFLECPPGQAAVGYTARSGCYSLTNVTVSVFHPSPLPHGAYMIVKSAHIVAFSSCYHCEPCEHVPGADALLRDS